MNGTNNGSGSKGSATKGSDQSVKTSAARRVEGTVQVEGTNVVRVPLVSANRAG
ncbi:MAG: hypothetical protein NTW02_00245 [Cyanobium sp. LacPavin_0920_WC12_MAG_62_9]|nr:hypothetical protein [Cyanobium sp. LacPavin_0920_WC12_MAG_62_9]